MTLNDLKNSINNFSIPQMLSNSDGKTSATATTGVIVTLIGLLCFVFGAIDKGFISHTTDIMMYSTGIITIGTSLLGVNKLSKGVSTVDEAVKLAGITPPTNTTGNDTTTETKQINS